MRRCMRIKVFGKLCGSAFGQFVQKNAKMLAVEGTVSHSENGGILIHACGSDESLNELIDALYAGTSDSKIEDVKTESVMLEKDFRGVFRILGCD